MNDNLVSRFKDNKVLVDGFKNPKCMQAMQLMQTNPKEAQRRFAGDPEVDRFLREFGRIMADHFTALGEQQSPPPPPSSSGSAKIQEVGPLQSQAMKTAAAPPANDKQVQEVWQW